eukprot:TRINITY_DN36214_c0_g1_i3.p1 TRINITY_DN36214_c0_g1~~TRINITY_DN36214_c0_g1_i3.p1  ORF type:complete len:570 (-),score=43.80 TRINITY_DN36214_c0_g1_i3:124-1833(-)
MRNLLKGYETKGSPLVHPRHIGAPPSVESPTAALSEQTQDWVQIPIPVAPSTVMTADRIPASPEPRVNLGNNSEPKTATRPKELDLPAEHIPQPHIPPRSRLLPAGKEQPHNEPAVKESPNPLERSARSPVPRKSANPTRATQPRTQRPGQQRVETQKKPQQRPLTASGALRSSTPKISNIGEIVLASSPKSPMAQTPQKTPVSAHRNQAAEAVKAETPVQTTPSVAPSKPLSSSQVKRRSTASAVRKLELDRLKRRLAMSEKKQASLDYYQSVKVIGAGSYGKVWVSRHKLSNREVAIKILDKSKLVDTDSKKRVAQEIRIMGKLKHPHIIRLFEVIEENGDINMIMEYASQGSFYDLLKKRKRFGENEARRHCAELLTAVEYIHAKNFYHRDIKLANILLSSDGTIKLADFGLGVFKSEGKKLIKFCGSPAYLAPEIILGQGYDGAAVDMWCVGIVLYALLVGDLPFRADSFPALRKRILKGILDFNSLSLSDSAQDFIGNLLSADPTARCSAAGAMGLEWLTQDPECVLLLGQTFKEHESLETLDWDGVSKLVEFGIAEELSLIHI